jgi:hypothetical protein
MPPDRRMRALRDYAGGEVSRHISQWERLKTDPDYVYALIQAEAAHSDEQLRRAPGGPRGPSARALLRRPRFVCMRLRFLAHNVALRIARWSCIVACLHDVEALDAQENRTPADRRAREGLVNVVKEIAD